MSALTFDASLSSHSRRASLDEHIENHNTIARNMRWRMYRFFTSLMLFSKLGGKRNAKSFFFCCFFEWGKSFIIYTWRLKWSRELEKIIGNEYREKKLLCEDMRGNLSDIHVVKDNEGYLRWFKDGMQLK